jgi:transcriptional regulator with XRE-family HTH domain
MRNERLRALLLERGKSPDQLAEHVRVDAKTVERWIHMGRVPHRETRWAVAHELDVDEVYLWPELLEDRSDSELEESIQSELVGVMAPAEYAYVDEHVSILRRIDKRKHSRDRPGPGSLYVQAFEADIHAMKILPGNSHQAQFGLEQ